MQKLNKPTPCQLYLMRQTRGELPEERPMAVFEGSGAPKVKVLPTPKYEEATIIYSSVSEVKDRTAEVLAQKQPGVLL